MGAPRSSLARHSMNATRALSPSSWPPCSGILARTGNKRPSRDGKHTSSRRYREAQSLGFTLERLRSAHRKLKYNNVWHSLTERGRREWIGGASAMKGMAPVRPSVRGRTGTEDRPEASRTAVPCRGATST